MNNPTVPRHLEQTAAAPATASHRERPVSSEQELVLSRVWMAVNLAAVGALGATLSDASSLHGFVAWASFTLLNALLHLASRTGVLVGNAAAHSAPFNTALAGLLGLAWGIGMVLLIPDSSAAQLAAQLSVAFAVALVAIPVFSEHSRAYTYFLTTLAIVAVLGIARDGRFMAAALWVFAASASLLLVAGVFYRTHARLRHMVELMLDACEPQHAARTRVARDTDLATAAERKHSALRHLVASNDRNSRLLSALGDAVIATSADGTIDYANPIAEVLLARNAKDLLGRKIEDSLRIVFPPDRSNHARGIFEQTRLTRRSQFSDDNAQLIRRDGVIYGVDYVVTPIRDEAGEFCGAAYVLRDVTEKRHRAESVAWQATHDPLTGTINRTEFEIRVKKLLRRSVDDERNVHALLYIDVDKFKFINDTYGHAAGDAALKKLADVLRTRIRGADTLARIGGDEFSALLYSCTADKSRLIAESLRIAVERENFKWQDIELPLSLSIGVVEINRECKSTAAILRAADSACYTAKKFGRNRVHVFDGKEKGESRQARVFDYVKDIQTAIHGNRLELFYQPFQATGTRPDVAQCELSVGIRNAHDEMIPHEELAGLARRYHLTEDIDRWMVKAAFDSLRLNQPVLSEMNLVLIPLSAQSMADDRLLNYVTRLVRDNPEHAQRIGFSFEDTGVNSHLEYMRYFSTALKQYGCRFMVGDLGFSSQAIELLKSMQADFLGIRGVLVQSMLYSSVDYEVVLGLSRIAHSLGMKTIAEDADTRALRDALAKMGIDYAKGELNEQPRRISIYSEAQWI